jgi:hypothetical protein
MAEVDLFVQVAAGKRVGGCRWMLDLPSIEDLRNDWRLCCWLQEMDSGGAAVAYRQAIRGRYGPETENVITRIERATAPVAWRVSDQRPSPHWSVDTSIAGRVAPRPR